MTDTILTITGLGIPSYAARGLTQSITPIAGSAQMRRTINGDLLDISASQFRKYQSSIQCRDMRAPAFDGVFPGEEVTVSCVAELSYLTAGGSPARPVVASSSRTEGSFTFYRPVLTMLVRTFNVDVDEWGAEVGWTLELEEV